MEEQQQQAKRQRSSAQQQGAAQQPRVPCARCGSEDTKFCYYNNYNTSQPRYFCRTCKRHWTHGGTLRNVPEGGSKKVKKIKPSSSSSSLKLPHQPQFLHNQAPVVAAGIGNFDRGVAPPPFFYGGRAGGGVIGDELGLVNNLAGDFGRASPSLAPLPGFNPLDGINLQQLVQQPQLSLALRQNLLMFQQQQQGNWRQNSPTAPFTTSATSSIAAHTGAADTAVEINRQNSIIFNTLQPPPPPPPPPSSFM